MASGATTLDLSVSDVHHGGTVSQEGPVTRSPLGEVMTKLGKELDDITGPQAKPSAAMERMQARKAKRLADKKARDEKKAAKKDRRARVPQSIHIRADIAPGGAIHVRHNLSSKFFGGEGQPVLLALENAGTDDAPQAVWIQLAKPGSFAGHPSGKSFTLNRKVFEQIVTNFRGNKDGRLPIDFEHASEQDPAEGSIPAGGAPAQGWIVDLKLGDDGNLYAKVEWGTLARQYIRDGKYRFISPAIHLQMKDRESGAPIGAYLSSAGLTNQPFLDGMRPLAARRDGAGDVAAAAMQMAGKDFLEQKLRSPDEYMPAIRSCLGLTELSTHAECSEQLARLSERCSMADASGMHEGVDLRGKYLNALAECAGVSGSATMQDILDVVQDMIDDAMDRHVEEMHPGASSMSARQPPETTTTTTPTEEDNMDPKDKLAADLAAANTKVGTLEGEVTTLSTKLGTKDTELTTLRAAHEGLKVTVADVLATLKAGGVSMKDDEPLKDVLVRVLEQNKVLLTAKTERDEADILADVDRTMQTYGPGGLKQLTEDKRPALLKHRRESPASFNDVYPPMTREQLNDAIRLNTHVAPPAPRRPAPPPIDKNDPALQSPSALTSKLMTLKGIGYGEAWDLSARIIKGELKIEDVLK